MNVLESWYEVLQPSKSKAIVAKPDVSRMLLMYVIPLSLVTPVMLSMVVPHHPRLFKDMLPGDRLYIVALALFVLQVLSVPLIAWAVKNLAEMVDLKPSFRDSFLIVAVSATPLWLVSLLYVVPSLAFNLLMHAIAAVVSTVLVYLGISNVFGLHRRGARMMLTMAMVATASLGFGILLIAILMFWGQVQQLQFAVH